MAMIGFQSKHPHVWVGAPFLYLRIYNASVAVSQSNSGDSSICNYFTLVSKTWYLRPHKTKPQAGNAPFFWRQQNPSTLALFGVTQSIVNIQSMSPKHYQREFHLILVRSKCNHQALWPQYRPCKRQIQGFQWRVCVASENEDHNL